MRKTWAVAVVVAAALSGLAQTDPETRFSEVLRPGLSLSVDKGCGAVYKYGELLNFKVRSDRNGYLTVFHFSADKKVQILFPNKYHTDNRIVGGQEYTIPGLWFPFQLKVSPPAGKELLFAMVTERDQKLVPENFVDFTQVFPALTEGWSRSASLIDYGLSLLPPDLWWAAAMCVFYVETEPTVTPPPPPPPPIANGWALFVGISDYTVNTFTYEGVRYQVRDLRAPAGDARKMAETLKDLFPNQRVLTDNGATYDAIRRGFTEWLSQAPAEATVLFYFSGHGGQVPDKDGDETLDRKDETLITTDGKMILDDEIHRWVNELRAQRIVIISDSCHSGTIHRDAKTFLLTDARSLPPRLMDGFADDFYKEGQRAPSKVVALSACRPEESAWEIGALGHSLFTYCLLEGLKGAADQNGDKTITAQELFAHVKACVARIVAQLPPLEDGTQVRQNPELHDGLGVPVPLAKLK